MPLSLPGIVTGIAMLNFYKQIGLPQSLGAVIIGHATALVGIVVGQVLARPERSSAISEASSDLGATAIETFFYVTLPNIRSAIIGSALLCFTLSFDEIPVTYFLTGRGRHAADVYLLDAETRHHAGDHLIGVLIVVASLALILSPSVCCGRSNEGCGRRPGMMPGRCQNSEKGAGSSRARPALSSFRG